MYNVISNKSVVIYFVRKIISSVNGVLLGSSKFLVSEVQLHHTTFVAKIE